MSRRVLVTYFSASGETEQAAKEVAKEIRADLFEIKPQEPYTSADLNWNNKQSRSSVEMNNLNSRPAIVKKELNSDDYDEILIGFPIWWNLAPTIINTFLESYDFTGKTVILFATSGGSGIGNSEKQLMKQYPQIHWKPGRLINNNVALKQLIEMI